MNWGRKLILYCCLLSVFSIEKSFAQQKSRISYVIPEIVNVEIDNYLKTKKSNETTYIVLQNQNDTTSILVSTYDENFSQLAYLINNTNRYIKVGVNKLIPVLLRPDFLLSDNLHVIKNKGSEYEAMSNTLIGASGYLIVYKGFYHDAKLIKAEYFQH
jgi:hypothetical protein